MEKLAAASDRRIEYQRTMTFGRRAVSAIPAALVAARTQGDVDAVGRFLWRAGDFGDRHLIRAAFRLKRRGRRPAPSWCPVLWAEFNRNSGGRSRSVVATTSSEGGMPGRTVRNQDPKQFQMIWGEATAGTQTMRTSCSAGSSTPSIAVATAEPESP